jgi:hypothetical protein
MKDSEESKTLMFYVILKIEQHVLETNAGKQQS